MTSGRVAVRLTIHGRVQGVGYRYWLEREAARHGLAGTVRNRADGTVEAVCVGVEAAVEAVRIACRRGPSGAAVERVDAVALAGDDATAARAARGFTRLPTA